MRVYFEIQPFTRLGNWMFQYAAALAVSPEARGFLRCPNMRRAVMRSVDILHGLSLVDKLPEDAIICCEKSFRYEALPVFEESKSYMLSGFFQSPKYFNAKRDRILSHYRPLPEQLNKLKQKSVSWINESNVTSIHVRRGDYLKEQFNFPFVGKQYFRDAVARMPDVRTFVVFSDDIPWCKRFFPKEFPDKRFYFSEGNSAAEDLYLQSMCRNNIISNSSFSWWGAWLNEHNDKRVVAPSMWFGFYNKCDWRDIYDKGWIVIPTRYTALQYAIAVCQLFWRNFKIVSVKARNGFKKSVGLG